MFLYLRKRAARNNFRTIQKTQKLRPRNRRIGSDKRFREGSGTALVPGQQKAAASLGTATGPRPERRQVTAMISGPAQRGRKDENMIGTSIDG